jgi:uncharacterized repeat protein (TIGR01451 family)
MKKLYMLSASVLTGVVAVSTYATPVAAWHPKGSINKSVQNVTSNGLLVDANDAKAAVNAKTGDTLKYVIVVSNTGSVASNGYNDMHKTVMKDTLPEGVELVSDPSKRQIVEDLGVLKPGQKVAREYLVKVTSEKDKAVITNKACFTGDSAVNDSPQSGCDDAVVKVSVPEKPKTPEEPAKGEDKPQVLPAVLPETGIGSVAGIFTGASVLGYAAHSIATRKRQ